MQPATRTEWMELSYARMNHLLDSVHDAESYALFNPMPDSWFRYFYEYPEPDIERRRTCRKAIRGIQKPESGLILHTFYRFAQLVGLFCLPNKA